MCDAFMDGFELPPVSNSCTEKLTKLRFSRHTDRTGCVQTVTITVHLFTIRPALVYKLSNCRQFPVNNYVSQEHTPR